MIRRLRRLHIGGLRSGLFHHGAQLGGILQHRAGLHHVLIEGLPVMVCLKQRRAHGFQQSLLPDVGIRIVDENAGVHIAIGVDVHIAAAPGNAAAHKLSIVLEVHGEQRLAGTVVADTVIDRLPLLRRGQELGAGVVTDGHVVEVPG